MRLNSQKGAPMAAGHAGKRSRQHDDRPGH